MLRSLFLLLLPVVYSKTLLLELECFRPPPISEAKTQSFELCIQACKTFEFRHSQPLGACAQNPYLENMPRRLNFDVPNASAPVLRVKAFLGIKKAIYTERRMIVDSTFDLRNLQLWPENGTSLPPSYDLNATKENFANLTLRAAWICRQCPMSSTSPAPLMLSTTRSTTTHPTSHNPPILKTTLHPPASSSLPLWAILVVSVGISSMLFCLFVIIFFIIQNNRKKKKKRAQQQELNEEQMRSLTRQISHNNAYDMRQSQLESPYEDLDRLYYEDPGTVYSTTPINSWDNDAYGARRKESESIRTMSFTRV